MEQAIKRVQEEKQRAAEESKQLNQEQLDTETTTGIDSESASSDDLSTDSLAQDDAPITTKDGESISHCTVHGTR